MSTSLHPQATATISSRTPSPQTAWAVSPSAGSHAGELPHSTPPGVQGGQLAAWLGRIQGPQPSFEWESLTPITERLLHPQCDHLQALCRLLTMALGDIPGKVCVCV